MRTKREKVLIGLVLLALVYGGYTVLSGGAGKKGKPGTQDAAGGGTRVEWVEGVKNLLTGSVISPLQQAVVARALEPWSDDLILSAPLPSELIERERARQEAIRKAAEAAEAARRRKLEDAEAARRRKLEDAEQRKRFQGELRKRFVYSGYAYTGDIGETALCAVINGVVYKQGEELEGGGHVVKSITLTHVVIVSSEQGIEVTIPISE